MNFLDKSINVSFFQIENEAEFTSLSRDEIIAKLNKLKAKTKQELNSFCECHEIGWCRGNGFSGDITEDDIADNRFISIAMRENTGYINKKRFKDCFQKACSAYMEHHDTAFIPRKDKLQIKNDILAELKENASNFEITSKELFVVIDKSKGNILFGSKSEKDIYHLADLFFKTFGMQFSTSFSFDNFIKNNISTEYLSNKIMLAIMMKSEKGVCNLQLRQPFVFIATNAEADMCNKASMTGEQAINSSEVNNALKMGKLPQKINITFVNEEKMTIEFSLDKHFSLCSLKMPVMNWGVCDAIGYKANQIAKIFNVIKFMIDSVFNSMKDLVFENAIHDWINNRE